MITCRELAQLLIDFVSGELPPEHHDLVEKHLCLCPPCVVFLETYRLTIKLTRQLPCGPLPAGLRDRLLACLQEINEPQRHRDTEKKDRD